MIDGMIRATPNINTAHLTLRAMRPEDFERYAEIWSKPAVVRHIGNGTLGRAEAWDSFLRIAGHWQMVGFGSWAVIEQETREMIGQIGFVYGTQGLGADFDAYPEAGWILIPRVHGQGYGREAAVAAHDWLDRIMPGPVVARVAVANTASLALADRLGYRPMRQIETAQGAELLLRRDKPPSGK